MLNAFLYVAIGVPVLLLLQRRYSVIHAHQIYTSGVVACLAARLMRNKRVVIKNGAGSSTGDIAVLKKMRLGRSLVRLINAARATIVCVNEETRKESETAGFRRVIRIPNGINPGFFCRAGDEEKQRLRTSLFGFRPSGPVVLFVGRLGPEKNVPALIRAISLVKHDCILSIIGSGILRKQLSDFAAACGISGKVHFAGETQEVVSWYQAADLFVLPSFSEGMPNVLLEAMASSLPVIASAIPSISEIIVDGTNGVLFPPGQPEALAGQIDRLCADRAFAERIGTAARRMIVEGFGFPAIVKRYERIYQQG
jgi:glycosyltransferase involved in cell wall biosynthesis